MVAAKNLLPCLLPLGPAPARCILHGLDLSGVAEQGPLSCPLHGTALLS